MAATVVYMIIMMATSLFLLPIVAIYLYTNRRNVVYICPDCKHQFTKKINENSASLKTPKCPKCGAKNVHGLAHGR